MHDSKDIFVERHAEHLVRTALQDTRIVAIVGPRQSGKTMLARRIADRDGWNYVSLDEEQYRQFAQEDPLGFITGLGTAVIDEIQRAPNLILEIKKEVDEDPTPGRFLITGSVELFKSRISPDSLAGRVETIKLLPFSQSEIAGTQPSRFLDQCFNCNFPVMTETKASSELIERIVSGGYPEAVSRIVPARRRAWFVSYINYLVEHDVGDITPVEKRSKMTQLVELAAISSGQQLNMSRLGSYLEVDSKTIDRWLNLLNLMFLVDRIPAWHHSQLKRLVKTPKLHFLDSGLLSALLRMDAISMNQNRSVLGSVLESFVYSEIVKATALSDETISISHYRDKDGYEVDFVLERFWDKIVGIEVKASKTAQPKDFRGLKRLMEATGKQFACGILLHDGKRTQQIAPRLYAMPISMLWKV
ncbi:MAG: ATP-binding protein [Gammaproteobacteria bacterium]|nr:ATP-binding protein [Gammaproteobacteria bacterium]